MSQTLLAKQVVSEWRETYQRLFAAKYPRVRMSIEDVALTASPTIKGQAVILIADYGVGHSVTVVYRTILIQGLIEEDVPADAQSAETIRALQRSARRKVMGYMPALEPQQYKDAGFIVVPDLDSLTGAFRIEQILTNALTHMSLDC
jgi:hypothetical protein